MIFKYVPHKKVKSAVTMKYTYTKVYINLCLQNVLKVTNWIVLFVSGLTGTRPMFWSSICAQ